MFENYEKFKKDVLTLTKIDLNCYKEKQMKRRIDTLIGKTNAKTYDQYVSLLKTDKAVLEQFVNFLTINEWKALFCQNLKIWSAACSTGDEPYSLVMALSKHIPLNQIHILATDIDKQVLEKARVGLYNEKSIANVPEDLRKRVEI